MKFEIILLAYCNKTISITGLTDLDVLFYKATAISNLFYTKVTGAETLQFPDSLADSLASDFTSH